VLRLADSLLAIVDENLRGMPVKQAGVEAMDLNDYNNLPATFELIGGVPKPKHWTLYIEGRRRLGFSSISEESQMRNLR
jgi:hypothetical protein